METDRTLMTDEKWEAIISNDASYNGEFFYAVKTTGIFCKPSCKSRVPKRDNVRIFQHAEQALAEQFRPCKRCKPTNERLPDHEWIAVVTKYIDKNFNEKLTLEFLAEVSHGSPYHLHRTFKRITGQTPVEYIQGIRIGHAKELLIQTDRATSEIALSVGLQNVPYFITLFKKKTGYTPLEFRRIYEEGARNG
ncbi:bifunctional transcriptional activator/DNA repair enzyme AdaA [Ferdinandcohnia quinoae]|uniref:Bifunctional transcriptional activator/DNA repair enzyme AdaA n=1 Tax=Fredinandcohnia quinoae TaxID=2918902 RepID=A0AAW5E7X9_9BACI|nr:bifunctional transcriptional activator/DNA repair enzyme AdaA [Fredinandcohnia sp. SECRCQ15]